MNRNERMEWYVAGMKFADKALEEAYPDMNEEERRKHAAMFAAADGIADEVKAAG